MTKQEKKEIVKRHRTCPNLEPFAVTYGDIGVVVLGDRLSLPLAAAAVDFIRNASSDMYALITEINRMETIIAYMDKHAPRSDHTCDEPGIALSVAVERELRDRNHPLFVETTEDLLEKTEGKA